jgi:hypothetical protein
MPLIYRGLVPGKEGGRSMMPQVGKFDIKEKVFEASEEWAQCREI